MAVLKRRPRIALLAPRAVPLGREVELTAILDSGAPVPIRGVQLDISGRALWITEGEHGPESIATTFHRAGADLREEGELPPGRLELPARFTLPPALPGSYRGQRIRIVYTATVKVDIPWWPDAVESFELQVAPAGPAARLRPAIAYSSPVGTLARAPHLELSLATTELVPGAVLEAAASFDNADRNRYRRLEVDLFAIESRKAFLGGTNKRIATRWVSELDTVRTDQPLRLRLRLPHDLTPELVVGDLAVTWQLRARALVDRGRDPVVAIPVTIHPTAAPEVAVRAPPEVGSERVRALWSRVGAENGLVFTDGRLAGTVADARLAVWRELSGRRGPRLVAELELAPLRVGLALDRRELRARDPRHQGLLSRRLAEPLRAAAAVSASDRQVRCETRGAGDRRPALAAFISGLVVLAHAIQEVRGDLAAPSLLEPEIPMWRDAARALGARLERAGPALIGQHDGLDFEIAVEWTAAGDPADLEVAVRAPAPIDRRHHLRWHEWDPQPTDDAIGRLCERAHSLEIDRAGVRLRLERAAGLESARAQLARLAALVRDLSGPPASGAYR